MIAKLRHNIGCFLIGLGEAISGRVYVGFRSNADIDKDIGG